jgi:glycerol kinase
MAMEMASPLTSIRVDGGGSQNSLLMQFQSDILGIPIEETEISESTSLGAAFMVGLAVGFWDSLDALRNLWHRKSLYEPSMDLQYRHEQIKYWEKAVDRSRSWLD